MNLEIIPVELLSDYLAQVNENLPEELEKLHDSGLSAGAFSFYTSVSAVFSSKIEGENIELDSFIKHKRFGIEYLPDYTRKTEDLYNAYLSAQASALNETAIAKAHGLITQNILPEAQQGKVRTGNMFVITEDGKIEYVAASPGKAAGELQRLYQDIEIVKQQDISLKEVFFFASMIHLIFVKIHPFTDGNGRMARLLEKWFIAEKAGNKSWFVQSEKYYYNHHQTYYDNIRRLGLEYPLLDYSKALPFLLMLPKALYLLFILIMSINVL